MPELSERAHEDRDERCLQHPQKQFAVLGSGLSASTRNNLKRRVATTLSGHRRVVHFCSGTTTQLCSVVDKSHLQGVTAIRGVRLCKRFVEQPGYCSNKRGNISNPIAASCENSTYLVGSTKMVANLRGRRSRWNGSDLDRGVNATGESFALRI